MSQYALHETRSALVVADSSLPTSEWSALEYFNSLPKPSVIVKMDASDHGLCALDITSNVALIYQFLPRELRYIARFKTGEANGFDINFRELLSCAFATHARGSRWSDCATNARSPLHVRFLTDNRSAVAWKNRLASRNTRAQDIIRLLGYWESSLNLRFSASHIAGANNARPALDRASPHTRLMLGLTRGWTQVSPVIVVDDLSTLAQYLRVHSVAASTFTKYSAAMNKWTTSLYTDFNIHLALAGRYEEHPLSIRPKESGTSVLGPGEFFP
ncbi:hypothetical protein PHMEG_00032967 [Phytophthora megakarya]|uniref:Uncharacterized protein n=1 Tax=Phytophthora megakarya TaxID=4795 RepID=A0A225UUD1_9STRA|nr:hypothetical protein PHMEG_00032967 [Phytophthora megakarya]